MAKKTAKPIAKRSRPTKRASTMRRKRPLQWIDDFLRRWSAEVGAERAMLIARATEANLNSEILRCRRCAKPLLSARAVCGMCADCAEARLERLAEMAGVDGRRERSTGE